VQGERITGSVQQPQLLDDIRRIDIDQLNEPVSENENLQQLALEQVRFQKQLPLQVLMAYSATGEIIDLTEQVDQDGKLDWTAPEGSWKLYALFQGWHGKMVERAAPGGEGMVIDHFSEQALKDYLQRFDDAFSGYDVSGVRAFFNDSYEVDDARGQADWTSDLFGQFIQRRGYDLRDHLPALFGEDQEDKNIRVLCDYRETISDLLLEKFTVQWQKWAGQKGAIIRNQAHGSPANILDLYAASDIPETEGTDLLRIKFASSASNVTGKKLTSSESATWLNEHFISSLADVRVALDRYFLGGVNHVFYHGTNYSPQDEDWPGWLFYAAVHFSPQNSFWNDFSKLNGYVARVQSFLQTGAPDNDVLLYFPVYDRYSEPGNMLLEHFSGGGRRFQTSVCRANAETLQDRGYAFDFVSDRQLSQVQVENSLLQTGSVSYQTIVLPACRFVPLETFAKLIDMAENGATIIVFRELPHDVPGLGNLAERQTDFQELITKLAFSDAGQHGVQEARLEQGRFLMGDDLHKLLEYADIRRESMVEQGLQFYRRKNVSGNHYFVANRSDGDIDGWITLAVDGSSAAIFDPMHDKAGIARSRVSDSGNISVYLQLPRGESCVLQTYDSQASGRPYDYYEKTGEPFEINGPWEINFIAGGPELPATTEVAQLGSWTDLQTEGVGSFSGTARYVVSFQKPWQDTSGCIIDLGRVCESAGVKLNGVPVGTLIDPDYRLYIPGKLIEESNVLEVAVSNLMANRIADLDRRQVLWKKFYNVNFPARRRANRGQNGLFDASGWQPIESGLLGPVTLTRVQQKKF
jgi:hypothetical protein